VIDLHAHIRPARRSLAAAAGLFPGNRQIQSAVASDG
jgi:hypothetical protein